MDFKSLIKNRNLIYILLFLISLGVGAIFFLDRYFYIFADRNASGSSSDNIDVANVDIKKLDTSILKTNKFKSLQSQESETTSTDSFKKGKRNPFLPN